MEKRAFTIEEAMEVSGLGRDLIYAEINRGNLKTLKIGRRRLIRVEALACWLETHEQKTTEAMRFTGS